MQKECDSDLHNTRVYLRGVASEVVCDMENFLQPETDIRIDHRPTVCFQGVEVTIMGYVNDHRVTSFHKSTQTSGYNSSNVEDKPNTPTVHFEPATLLHRV